MGSISGLIFILLLADLCTCSISGQNPKLKMINYRRFFLGLNEFYGADSRD